jgi:hypothetical protein
MYGPRSLMRTLIDRPLACAVTITMEPSRLVLCAAVIAWGFNRSPDAVFVPSL